MMHWHELDVKHAACSKYNLLVWYDDSVLISASSVGFAFVLKLHFVDFIKFLLWVVFVDCISVGVVIATTLW